MSTPKHMRRYFPNQESSEVFSNGNLVWLQEVIKNNDDNLVVKRTLSNYNRPLSEKYKQYEIDKIREMNNSLGVYSGGKKHFFTKRHFFKKSVAKTHRKRTQKKRRKRAQKKH
jgi:hypothetical protein